MTASSDKSDDTSSDNREANEEKGQATPSQRFGAPYPYPYRPGSQPGYPPPPYAGYPPAAPKNGLGIASLVLAIGALVLVWSVAGGIVLGIAAAVLGVAARQRVKRGEANNGGMAIAGIALGLLAVVIGLVFIPIWIAIFQDAGVGSYVDCLQKAGSDRARQQQCADQFQNQVQDQFGVSLTPTPPMP